MKKGHDIKILPSFSYLLSYCPLFLPEIVFAAECQFSIEIAINRSKSCCFFFFRSLREKKREREAERERNRQTERRN